MVLTGAKITSFFEEITQVAISHETRIKLQEEGIDDIDDIADFDKYTLKQVADNLRRPGGWVPDPDTGATRGSTSPSPPF